MYKIVVYHNLNKNNHGKEFYYKKLKGYYCEYYIGYINQFNHEVILIIDMPDVTENYTIKNRIINKLQNWLNKINN